MSIIYKNKEKIKIANVEGMPLFLLRKYPPRAIVEKVEKWCERNNAETTGYKKNISRHLNNPRTIFLKDFLIKNSLKQFDLKILIDMLEARYLTDGSLQRQILNLFVCSGFIKKDIVEYKNKKGEDRFKILYSINENGSPCPYLKFDEKGKSFCDYNWTKARETKYFTEKNEDG